MKTAPYTSIRLREVYALLFDHFGPLHWWPGESPLEICVGAILTQNTAWTNVEKAIANLKKAEVLALPELAHVPEGALAEMLRPSGYFNVKARRLRAFLGHVMNGYRGDLGALLERPLPALRKELLGINGVGQETADSMILYAAGQPVFVIDAYTRRAFHRLGFTGATAAYEELQKFFVRHLEPEAALYNEYHAQIVYLGKDFCKPKPKCGGCPLLSLCPHGQGR